MAVGGVGGGEYAKALGYSLAGAGLMFAWLKGPALKLDPAGYSTAMAAGFLLAGYLAMGIHAHEDEIRRVREAIKRGKDGKPE